MKLFQELGAEIEKIWREQNYNEDQFPSIAADALRRSNLPAKISPWEVIEWTLQQDELPPQKDPLANFGEPPITVFTGPRFFIDVYFWLDGTTQIHQHSFCGAFQVLIGSSIHSWYEFERTERVNAFTEIGRMELKVCELLEVGDVQEILAGRQYIHSLFHLDQPSVTIVVRTDQSPLHLPQFSYHKPSLALDPFFEHTTTRKKLQAIQAMFQVSHPDVGRMVSELLENSDFQTSYAILFTVHGALGHGQLGRLFNLEGPAARFREFLAIVDRKHGAVAKDLAAVFDHRDRMREIVRRRGYVTNAEHRFFFALLLNVEGRGRIFSLIRQRFPDADPIAKVLDWVYELSQTRVVGVSIPNALGIEGFGDVDLSLLDAVLHDLSDEEAYRGVTEEYGADRTDRADLEAKLARMHNSIIFMPLLTE